MQRHDFRHAVAKAMTQIVRTHSGEFRCISTLFDNVAKGTFRQGLFCLARRKSHMLCEGRVVRYSSSTLRAVVLSGTSWYLFLFPMTSRVPLRLPSFTWSRRRWQISLARNPVYKSK